MAPGNASRVAGLFVQLIINNMKTDYIPRLIAHRGYSSCFPENTLLSLEQAFLAGACFVECDVQLTKDDEPVILHDAELLRTAGVEGNVLDLAFSELATRHANYQQRFADKFAKLSIPPLSDFVSLMQRWPARKAFVEIKRASIRKFGCEPVLQQIFQVVRPIKDQVVIISFDYDIMKLVQDVGGWQTGWVIDEWHEQNLQLAQQLKPDFMFVDYECLPQDLPALPEASWRWALYEIDDPQLALTWLKKGATFIETNDIGRLLQLPEFSPGACHDNPVL